MKGWILRQTWYFVDARFPFYVVLNKAAMLRKATPCSPRVTYMATMTSFLKLEKTAKLVLLMFDTNSCNYWNVFIAKTYRHDGTKHIHTPVFAWRFAECWSKTQQTMEKQNELNIYRPAVRLARQDASFVLNIQVAPKRNFGTQQWLQTLNVIL